MFNLNSIDVSVSCLKKFLNEMKLTFYVRILMTSTWESTQHVEDLTSE